MIERSNEKTPYTAIKNKVLRSGFLALEELGLYAVMLSKPDNWEFSEFVLARELGTSQKEVHGILKRMEQKGFVRERSGRYGTVWDLFEMSEQLPDRAIEPRRNYTVPQATAKAFVDSVMRKVRDSKPDAEREQKDEPEKPEERQMTSEEIAQAFFKKAEELKKIAAERKAQEQACRNAQNRV